MSLSMICICMYSKERHAKWISDLPLFPSNGECILKQGILLAKDTLLLGWSHRYKNATVVITTDWPLRNPSSLLLYQRQHIYQKTLRDTRRFSYKGHCCPLPITLFVFAYVLFCFCYFCLFVCFCFCILLLFCFNILLLLLLLFVLLCFRRFMLFSVSDLFF